MVLTGLKGFNMVRIIAKKVHDAVMLDSAAMLTHACVLDFALDADFEDRFGALQTAARQGATAQDFDDALGSGKKITTLVAKYGSDVVFPDTIWDKMEAAGTG